jgi:hypothetical protein
MIFSSTYCYPDIGRAMPNFTRTAKMPSLINLWHYISILLPFEI